MSLKMATVGMSGAMLKEPMLQRLLIPNRRLSWLMQ